MTDAWVDTHDCPGGCGRAVPRERFACRGCWGRLPEDLRNRIWSGYQRPDRADHLDAMCLATEWYAEHRDTVGQVPCDHCGAPIVWRRTRNGVRAPIDAEPSAQGNVLIKHSHAGVLGKAAAEAARGAGQQLRLMHAVTCPFAAHWSKKRGGRR